MKTSKSKNRNLNENQGEGWKKFEDQVKIYGSGRVFTSPHTKFAGGIVCLTNRTYILEQFCKAVLNLIAMERSMLRSYGHSYQFSLSNFPKLVMRQ